MGQLPAGPLLSLRDALLPSLPPALLKGRVFDACIRLSLARGWREGGREGGGLGYWPPKIGSEKKEEEEEEEKKKKGGNDSQ